MKAITVKQQPPITVADLIAGATYHLRVYSHERNSISSKSISFKTKPGERLPHLARCHHQVGHTGSLSALMAVMFDALFVHPSASQIFSYLTRA